MPIYQRCPECSRLTRLHELDRRVTTKRCSNTKCRLTLPPFGRVLVLWYRDGSGKRHLETLGRVGLQVANAELAKRKAEIAEGRYGTRTWTWGEVCAAYLRHLAADEASESHQRAATRYLKEYSERWGGNLPAKQITPEMIEEMRICVRERGVSKRTADHYLQIGRAAWRYVLPDTPCPWSKVKLYNADNRRTEWLTDEERFALLQAAQRISRSFYEMVIVALLTGLRQATVLTLRRDHVDFQKKLITLREKGGKIRPKRVPDSVLKLLASIPDNGTPWFWVGYKGKPLHRSGLGYNLRKALAMAGIDRPFRWHGLRHDAATNITRLSGNLRVTQEFLGHSRISTTERYAHLLPSLLDAAIEQMDSTVTVQATVFSDNPNDSDPNP